MKNGIKYYIDSDNPLSDECIEAPICHKEEDIFVDYKETFDPKDEKDWLGLTTDVMAFANTMGGYIIFGIKDVTFSIVGLHDSIVKELTNTNMVIQKLNRYVAPPFTKVRIIKFLSNSLYIVVIYIPESKGKTHVFIKDVIHRYPNEKSKQLIHAGMIYIRRSATNHIIEPDDLEFIITRRIDYYKESILNKITKVIEAPLEHQILFFDPNTLSNNNETCIISDLPNAIPVKSMSFTTPPKTDVEEILGWIAFSSRDQSILPSSERLWFLYSKREELNLNKTQSKELIRFCLLRDIPVFFWMKKLTEDEIKIILLKVFESTNIYWIKSNILEICAFLSKSFFMKLQNKLDDSLKKRINYDLKVYPDDPFVLFHKDLIFSQKDKSKHDENSFCDKLKERLNDISNLLSEKGVDVMKKMEAKAIDCYLYARKDKYKETSKTN